MSIVMNRWTVNDNYIRLYYIISAILSVVMNVGKEFEIEKSKEGKKEIRIADCKISIC